MTRTAIAGAIRTKAHATSKSLATTRVAFMDNLRYLMVVFVVLYHAVGAYAIVAPHWAVHDTTLFAADLLRELFDVFIMPVMFFAAGYFGLVSLEKKGAGEFLKDKVKRLLIPWVLAVFILAPLALYDQPVKPVRPFSSYWLWYLSQFEVRLRSTQASVGPTTQMVYWFISLLFAFFVILALGYALVRLGRGTPSGPALARPPSTRSMSVALWTFGLLTSAAYLFLLLLVPDSSWFTLGMFLEFQVTRLVPYAGCFAFGVYAKSQGWFADGKPIENWGLWGGVSAVLALAYLVVGQPLFADTAGVVKWPIAYLMIFAFLRSFLLLSLLVVFLSFGIRYWNSANGMDRPLAAASYNIYLVHFLIVVALQTALLGWAGGPVEIKIAIVFLAGLVMSFAISRWILARHARAFAVALIALFVFALAVRP